MSHAIKPDRLPAAGHPQSARMPALIILMSAGAVNLLFIALLGYAVGFFAGFAVPKGIDQGPRTVVPAAAAIDLLLLLLFAVQHTVMARPWFKRRWTRVVWRLSGPGAGVLRALYAAGWAMAISATFLISHFVVIFWSAPTMTAGHLLFAVAATGYILAGIAFEEHDLIQSLGGTYAAYRARVPALLPRPSPRRRPPKARRSEENDRKQAT